MINGFVKRAQQYGFTRDEITSLVKQAFRGDLVAKALGRSFMKVPERHGFDQMAMAQHIKNVRKGISLPDPQRFEQHDFEPHNNYDQPGLGMIDDEHERAYQESVLNGPSPGGIHDHFNTMATGPIGQYALGGAGALGLYSLLKQHLDKKNAPQSTAGQFNTNTNI